MPLIKDEFKDSLGDFYILGKGQGSTVMARNISGQGDSFLLSYIDNFTINSTTTFRDLAVMGNTIVHDPTGKSGTFTVNNGLFSAVGLGSKMGSGIISGRRLIPMFEKLTIEATVTYSPATGTFDPINVEYYRLVSGTPGTPDAQYERVYSPTQAEFDAGDYYTRAVTGVHAKLSQRAEGYAGTEIGTIYYRKGSNIFATTLEQAPAILPGKFTYTPSTNVLAFSLEDLEEGDKIQVQYKYLEEKAIWMENRTDKFPGDYELTTYVELKNQCTSVVSDALIRVPKASLSPDFEISQSSSQNFDVYEFTMEPDTCNDEASVMLEIIILPPKEAINRIL